jgi:hypothetical protein
MRHTKRTPIIKATLEKRLLKNERRIQAIAEESFKLRQVLKSLNDEPKQVPYVKPVEEEGKMAEVFGVKEFMCICNHSEYRHPNDGMCNICNCKGFGATNLDWSMRNGNTATIDRL